MALPLGLLPLLLPLSQYIAGNTTMRRFPVILLLRASIAQPQHVPVTKCQELMTLLLKAIVSLPVHIVLHHQSTDNTVVRYRSVALLLHPLVLVPLVLGQMFQLHWLLWK